MKLLKLLLFNFSFFSLTAQPVIECRRVCVAHSVGGSYGTMELLFDNLPSGSYNIHFVSSPEPMADITLNASNDKLIIHNLPYGWYEVIVTSSGGTTYNTTFNVIDVIKSTSFNTLPAGGCLSTLEITQEYQSWLNCQWSDWQYSSLQIEIVAGPSNVGHIESKSIGISSSVVTRDFTFSNLTPGTYTFRVYDSYKPNKFNEYTYEVVSVGGGISVNINETQLNSGVNLTASASGSGSYTYQWDDPSSSTSASIMVSDPGTYCVSVTDASGCSGTECHVVQIDTTPPPCDIEAFVNLQATGGGGGNRMSGEVLEATYTGGAAPVTYLWDDPSASTSSTITVATDGTYCVTITDANGCTASDCYTVLPDTNTPPPCDIEAFVNLQATGGGGGNRMSGEVLEATYTGGAAPVTYLWDDPSASTSSTITVATDGTYCVTITDANGCTASDCYTVLPDTNTPPPCDIEAFVNLQVTGGGGGNRMSGEVLEATYTGGTAPVTYLWDDPSASTSSTITVATDGTYCVTITDANGCTASDCYTVLPDTNTNNPGCDLEAFVNIVPGGGGNRLSGDMLEATYTGGTAPVTYLWDDPNGSTLNSIVIPGPGTYCVTITDANGCTASDCYILTPDSLGTGCDFDVVVDVHKCAESLCLTAHPSGNGPYLYEWNDPDNTRRPLLCVDSGMYTVKVTDVTGCSVYRDVEAVLDPSDSTLLSAFFDAPEDMQTFSVYPNPAYNRIYITANFDMQSPVIGLFDLTGKQLNAPLSTSLSNVFELNLSGIVSGMYILRVESEGKIMTKSISVVQ